MIFNVLCFIHLILKGDWTYPASKRTILCWHSSFRALVGWGWGGLQLKAHIFLASPLPSPLNLPLPRVFPQDSTYTRMPVSALLADSRPTTSGLTDTCEGEKAWKDHPHPARPWPLKERELSAQSVSANDHCPQGAQPKPFRKRSMKRQYRSVTLSTRQEMQDIA